MKLAVHAVAAFLRDPGNCRVALLYGEDVGQIRARASALIVAVAGATDDPFRVATLDRDRIGTLPDEAAMLSLTGGRRAVRVRDVTDSKEAQAAITALLASKAPALVVLEAAGLASRTSLRTLIEAAPDGVAIACYPEQGRDLTETIRDTLAAARVRADAETIAWLGQHLGADRALTISELEKLALYAGPEGRVDLTAAMESVGDLAGLSVDDALFAATAGDAARADRALELALAEDATPVGALRAALMHLERLHRARLAVDAGQTPAEAARRVRPPIFFRRMDAFARALATWSEPALRAAIGGIAAAERNCKRTGAPDQALVRHAILALARRGGRGG